MNAHRKRTTLIAAASAAAVIVLIALTAGLVWGLISVAKLGGDLHALKVDKAESDAKVAALSAQVESLGGEPVVDPVKPTPSTATLTTEQVRAVVAEELLERDLQLSPAQVDQIAATAARMIPRPKDGVNGKSPTAAEVRAVVQQVVAGVCAGDACKGEKGDEGDQGQPGQNGQDAPPVTDEQLDARLAAYCAAHNDCMGRDGEPGPKGDRGESGPGVTRLDFVRNDAGECVARTTFSDGTSYESPAGDAACQPTPLLGG